MAPEQPTGLDELRANPLMTARLVAGVLAMANVISVLVAVGLVERSSEASPTNTRNVALGLLCAGILAAVAALFVRRVFLARPGGRPSDFVTATVLTFVMLEWTSLCGLVASLLDRDPKWVVGAAALSLVGMLLAWPCRAAFEARGVAGGGP